MPAAEWIGYLAGMLTTVAVVPQISKAWKTREVKDISVMMLVTLIVGVGLWIAYGILTKSWPIIITDGIAFLLNCFLLALVFYEGRKKH